MVAATTVTGMVVATAAIVFDRQVWSAGHDLSAGTGLASLVRTLSGVSDLQREAAVQLAEVRSDMAVLRDTGATPPATASASAPTRDGGSVTAAAGAIPASPASPAAAGPVPAPPAAAGPIATSSAARSPTGTGSAVSGSQSTGVSRVSTPVPARPGPAAGGGNLNLPPLVAASAEPAPAATETPAVSSEPRATVTAAMSVPAVPEPTMAAPIQPLPPVQASQARSKATPVRPRVYREAQYYHSYRRPPPRQQFVLANVFEGMRRNIYAIFH